MPQVMSAGVLPKSLARSLTVSVTVKKSKASQVCRPCQTSVLADSSYSFGAGLEATYPSGKGQCKKGPMLGIEHAD